MDLSKQQKGELRLIIKRLEVMKDTLHPAHQMNFDEAIYNLDIHLPREKEEVQK